MAKKRTRKISKRKSSADYSYIAYWLILGLVLLFIIFISIRISNLYAFNLQLKPLPQPAIRTISSPDPLILAKKSSSVLGFGTFDPLTVINAVNDERIAAGSRPLRANVALMRAATLRAETILKNQNFSHQDPIDQVELGTVLPRLNYHFIYASENIGMGGTSGRDFVDGFMHSAAHRINLLDPSLTDTGVAVVDGPFDRYYVNIVVQIFTIPGGKEEYLGYSNQDKKFYEIQLSQLNTRLDPLTWFFLGLSNRKLYSSENRKILIRQKIILETILSVMNKSEPLENNHVAMIREFNKNLTSL